MHTYIFLLSYKSLFPKKVEIPIPNLVTKECNEMIEDKQNRMRESKPKIGMRMSFCII